MAMWTAVIWCFLLLYLKNTAAQRNSSESERPPEPKIFKCSKAIYANVATAHFPNPQLIVKHYFKSLCWQNTRYPPTPLALSLPFLLTAPSWSCVVLMGVIVRWSFAGQLSYVESLSLVGGRGQWMRWVESGPLILGGTVTSLAIIAWWSQCSYSW